MLQSKPPEVSLLSPMCRDESQYWFAMYELGRRKPESQRDAGASLKINPTDTEAMIARKLAEFGYRTASRKYHPDRGGESGIMQKINAAIEYARKRLSA